jgi:Uma2 family endonuclease
MATALDIRHETLDAFLAWERGQAERYERLGGVVRMMTGGTAAHNRIIQGFAAALERGLRTRGCELFTSDMKVISPEGDVMYPDVVVACGEVPDAATQIDAPMVIVEIPSESTAARDHGPKRWAYQTIPSLRHYLLVDQTRPVVEVFSRDDGGTWRSELHRSPETRMRLEALGVEIALADVFARVTFGDAETDATG